MSADVDDEGMNLRHRASIAMTAITVAVGGLLCSIPAASAATTIPAKVAVSQSVFLNDGGVPRCPSGNQRGQRDRCLGRVVVAS